MVVTGESLLCTAIMDEEEESYVGTSSEENLEQDSLEVCSEWGTRFSAINVINQQAY
jgi:hypothetical protein